MNQGFIQPLSPHDFLGFYAVLFRILFKIQIVEQPHDSPEIHLIFIAQLLCKVSHNTFHGLRMLQMEFVLIVSGQKLPGFFPCWYFSHAVISFAFSGKILPGV